MSCRFAIAILFAVSMGQAETRVPAQIRVPIHAEPKKGAPPFSAVISEKGQFIEISKIVPFSAVSHRALILIDCSGSMSDKSVAIQNAVRQLVGQVLEFPRDSVAFAQFSEDAKMMSPFRTDSSDLEAVLHQIQFGRRTAMIDAIVRGAAALLTTKDGAPEQQPELFVVTDGGNNYGRITEGYSLKLLGRIGIPIHFLGVLNSLTFETDVPRFDDPFLASLANATGGSIAVANNRSQITTAVRDLSKAIQSTWILTIAMPTPEQGFEKHTIRFRLPKKWDIQSDRRDIYVFANPQAKIEGMRR